MKEAILVFDASGSIDSTKRKYYKEICDHYRNEYKISTVINHTTEARKYSCFSDEDFDKVMSRHESGGTYVSSGLVLALGEIIKQQIKPVIILCSDGDNWSEDNQYTFNIIKVLNDLGAKIIYHEILPSTYAATMFYRFAKEGIPCKSYIVKDSESDIFGEKQKREYTFYYIEHAVDGKLYRFRSYDNEFTVGDFVICNTSKGKTYGRICSIVREEMYLNEYNKHKTIKKVK